MQDGTSVDFPSHRPGNRCENSAKPPADNEDRLSLGNETLTKDSCAEESVIVGSGVKHTEYE